MDTELIPYLLFLFFQSFFFQDLTIYIFFLFRSICSPHLQILYLDSLDIGDIVNKDVEVRAAVWTGKLVSKVCLMDRVSDSQFGKLQVRIVQQRNFYMHFFRTTYICVITNLFISYILNLYMWSSNLCQTSNFFTHAHFFLFSFV